MFHSKIMIPIQQPRVPLEQQTREEDYSFSRNVYEFYTFKAYTIVKNDHDDWFLVADFTCDTLNELKYTRQIRRPQYMKDETLPAIDLLTSLNLQIPDSFRFDKAFGHVLYEVEALEDISPRLQLKIANYDGKDDPEVSPAMHYIQNIYDKEHTHFIAGIETYSFATITENSYLANHLWPENIGELYLLLFTYYKLYRTCPSYQMIPKLLCNVWHSTEALWHDANDLLYKRFIF